LFKVETKLDVLTVAFLSLIELSPSDLLRKFFLGLVLSVSVVSFLISYCLLLTSSLSVLKEIVVRAILESFGAQGSFSVFSLTFSIFGVKKEKQAIIPLDAHLTAMA
jgi:hypothetical protein